MAINIAGGGSTAGKANVTANYDLNVVTPQVELNAGFVQVSSEVDSGIVTGTRTVLPMEISDDYRVRVGLDQSIFNSSFEGTTLFTHQYTYAQNIMTFTQTGGYFIINNGNSVTNLHYVNFATRRTFTLFGTYPVYFDSWLKEANETTTGVISEWGIGIAPASTAAPTEGVFFRRNESGVLKAVVSYNGTETEEVIDTSNIPPRTGIGSFSAAEANHYLLVIHNDIINFWINDVLVSSIPCPGTQPTPTMSTSQPLMYRVRNTGTPSAGRRLEIGFINVTLGDQNSTKPWPHVLCGAGGGALVNTRGELIGINTMISSPTGSYTGYSFAVPSNITRKIIEDIMEFGGVQRGVLGIEGNELNSKASEELGIKDTEGFYINKITKNSGAEKAGLQKGDIIKKLDAQKINSFAELTGYINTKRPNDKVQVTFIRDGQTKTVPVTLIRNGIS